MSIETARVDALFAEWDRDDSPGCALGVIQGGELTYARGYGMANLDLGVPLTPGSVCHVASVSKQFTAIALALLAEEGKLSLDDEIHTHVPELPDLGYPITLRHLIWHTSGLRDQYGLFRLAGWRDDDVQTNDDVIDFALRHRRLNFPPGSEYAYCNTSYTLMAETIKRVTGKPYREFAAERFFQPLDMTNSRILDDHAEVVPNRASAYSPREGGGFSVNNANVDAVGAICVHTSVEDLARWVRNYRDRTVAGGVLEAAMTPGTLNDGTPLRYGYGLAVGTYRGLRTVGHGGVDAGYRSHVLYFPEADVGVVVLANLSSIKPGALARQVADIYLADRLGADALLDAPEVELPEEALSAKVGLYRDARRGLTETVTLEDGVLTVPGWFGERMKLAPLGDDRFRVGEPPIEVRFTRDADGTLQLQQIATESGDHTFTAVEQANPTAAELAAYAGTYYSPDLGVNYIVLVRGDKLIVRLRKMEDVELEPTVTDAFSTDMVDCVFSRDGRGDVNGFDIFTDRIRHLRFERLG